MIRIVSALFVVLALAGCVTPADSSSPPPVPAEQGYVEFSFSPEAPAAGDKVTFNSAYALPNGTTVETWTWNFDDGETIVGSLARHAYAYGGVYNVMLTASLTDGTTRTATNPVTVSGEQAPEGSGPGTQPTVPEPSEPSSPGSTGESNGTTNGAPVVTTPRDWPRPNEDLVRPGDAHAPDGCTLNFMYQYGERFFFGSAGHCLSGGPDDDGNLYSCGGDYSADLGTETTVSGHGMKLTLAYSAWDTMYRAKETDASVCSGNDFILLEINPKDLGLVHPAVHRYGGPTGLGNINDYNIGDGIRGYGRSNLHDDTIVYGEDSSITNPKTGVYLGQNYGGWAYNVYLLPQGIPGDSGGGIMDEEGLALGAASTISLAGGSNNYANIAWALDYMENHEGWKPELVTWAEWEPNPRVPT